MGMHADCGHGISMATSMAQLHMQAMTQKGPGRPSGRATEHGGVVLPLPVGGGGVEA